MKQWFRQSTVFFPLSVSVIALLWTWVLAFSFPLPLEEGKSVIVHYSVYFGIQQLGTSRSLFWFPILGSILFLVHGALAYFFALRDTFWSKTLLLVAALADVLIFFVLLFLFLLH